MLPASVAAWPLASWAVRRQLFAAFAEELARAKSRRVDHYVGEDGTTNGDLYMTEDEQRNALRVAGFSRVERVLSLRGLVLHRAQP